MAGSGKSTIAAIVAQYFNTLGRRGAYLFFERSTSDPNALVRTLAHQPTLYGSNICAEVCNSIRAKRAVAEDPPQDQFEKLLNQLLRRASERLTSPIVIVLDALDECGDISSRTRILRLLAEEFPRLPPIFRFLVTSRRELDIDARFSLNPEAVTEMELMTGESEADLEAHIWFEMKKIRDLNHLPDDWPRKDQVDRLVKHSEGLFIWVSIMSRFLTKILFMLLFWRPLVDGSRRSHRNSLD